jgi:hypothetical protein
MRGTLPPQAYTREVVANAYNWLQTQPEQVRRMAQNTDTLVALYLRVKRNSDNPMGYENEPAASVENFRSQLKNLASEIQQFVPEQEKMVAAFQQPETPPQQLTAPAPKATGLELTLDPQSLEILKKVRQHLNLSSDTEAMRMLLVLGFEKIQALLKS